MNLLNVLVINNFKTALNICITKEQKIVKPTAIVTMVIMKLIASLLPHMGAESI